MRPFTFVISRLKYGRKFVLISLLFLIPVLICLYYLVSSQQEQIRRLSGEITGAEQAADFMPYMLLIQQHRGLLNGYLNGNVEAKASIEAKQREIAEWMERIEADFRKTALPQTYEQWLSVKEAWDFILRFYESMAASESFERHTQLVGQVEELIKTAADESGLSLDSEIDTYYMIRLTVEELPELIEGTAVIRGRGNGVLAAKSLTDVIRTELLLESDKSRKALLNLNKSLARIAGYDRDDGEELLMRGEQAAQSIKNYLELLDKEILHAAKLSMDPDEFFSKGTETIAVADDVFRLASELLIRTLQERIDAAQDFRNVTLAITGIALLLVAVFYIAFYMSVMDAVHALKRRAEAMAEGDFTRDVVLNTRDELQLIGKALNEMQTSMNLVLGYNRNMAATTLESSRQLSDIAQESTKTMQQVAVSLQEVSEGTTVQDKAVSEMATALNEMSAGVMRIAEAASEAANLALRTTEQAERGSRQLDDTVNQMANIQKTQSESSQIVAKLDEHSANIGGIINAIMELAAQTKLLALNASIEAARAGEHGRGFGVVAQEVGKLAEETSRSGKSISDLLNVIRSLIRQTVDAMESVQKETNLGMTSIEQTKAVIQSILSDINRVNDQIQEVSAVSEEISAETEEVTASIAEISNISHKTSNEAETMAASSEEQLASMEHIQSSARKLKDMSEQLTEELSKFKLRS